MALTAAQARIHAPTKPHDWDDGPRAEAVTWGRAWRPVLRAIAAVQGRSATRWLLFWLFAIAFKYSRPNSSTLWYLTCAEWILQQPRLHVQ